MVALRQSEIDFIAGQVVSETVERQGNALIETVAGNEQLVKVAKQYINCANDLTQGRMFEIIETTKFNANAAKAGSMLRAVTTDQLGCLITRQIYLFVIKVGMFCVKCRRSLVTIQFL